MKLECKKLIFRRESLILFLLAFLFMVIFIVRLDTYGQEMSKYYNEWIAEYRMPYSEAVSYLREELASFDVTQPDVESDIYYEYNAISNLLYSAEKLDEHNEEIKTLLTQLERQIQNAPTEYVRRDLQKAYDLYNRAYEYHVFNTDVVQSGIWHLEETTLTYLYVLFVLAFFCGMFTIEHESGMYQLLFSSKRGKRGLFFRKVTGAVPCIIGIALLFTVIPFIGVWAKMGLSFYLLGEPIQAIDYFSLCPYALTIGQYLLLSFVMHIVVGLLIVAVLTLCSAFLKKGMQVFGVSSLFIIGSAILCTMEKTAPTARKFGCCGLLKLQEYLTGYDTVNVAGIPVMRFHLAIAFTVMLSLTLLLLAYIVYTREPKGGKTCR